MHAQSLLNVIAGTVLGLAVAAGPLDADVPRPAPGMSCAAQLQQCVPSAEALQTVVDAAHAKYKDLKDGNNADYIPILATVPSELFAVVIATRDGELYRAGDVDYRFSIQSTSKPFTVALLMRQFGGPAMIRDKIGVEPTGLPFNSKLAIQIHEARSVNPMVNAGALAAVSLVKASGEAQRWALVHDNLNDFAGATLPVLEQVYKSEYETAWSNRSIANELYNDKRLYSDPEETLRVYTRQCSVGVTTAELAIMGATLANGGVNPKTGERLLDEQHVPELLALMMMAGFYDESGAWSYTAGLPAKTGVGGGIIAVVPGRFAIAAERSARFAISPVNWVWACSERMGCSCAIPGGMTAISFRTGNLLDHDSPPPGQT